MSCNYYVFIGPYLEVHNPVQDIPIKQNTCLNIKCSEYHKRVVTRFCSECGGKVLPADVPARGRKEFDIYHEFKSPRVYELSSEDLQDENYMYFRSNTEGGGMGLTFGDDCGVFPIEPTTPATEIQYFSQILSKEIARMTEIFGKDNVKIKWGAIAYWS